MSWRCCGALAIWAASICAKYRNQPKGQVLVWLYGMFSDVPGDYVKKPMRDCTGMEICEEWLYHLGVPVDQIEEMAQNSANTVPVMMPFASAYFQPREAGDRPDVVPAGSVNFAFIGNFAETPRDTVFTVSYTHLSPKSTSSLSCANFGANAPRLSRPAVC